MNGQLDELNGARQDVMRQMNEVPAGLEWPDPAEQLRRTEEALTIITKLLDGETVDFAGKFLTTKGAKLYSPPKQRPPVILSAFGEHAARLAGRPAGLLQAGRRPAPITRRSRARTATRAMGVDDSC